jgi:hypothetical protein
MIVLRQSVAACGLAWLIVAATPLSTAAADGGRPSAHRTIFDLWDPWPGPFDWWSHRTPRGYGRLPGRRAFEHVRPDGYRQGEVSSDFGLETSGLGVEDSLAVAGARRVKIDIKDLLQNDLGWQCDRSCTPKKTNKLKLTALTGNDNIERIVQKGKRLYVQSDDLQKRSTFTYRVFDRDSRASADVRVNLWFGNREPKAKHDKLVGFANTENVFEVADLLGNDRDDDGDLLDLVRVWCPKDGRVFVREVDGEVKIFFQPDKNFTGVTYFNYTIADLSDPEDVLVAGPGAARAAERMTFAAGIVRVRVLASPS